MEMEINAGLFVLFCFFPLSPKEQTLTLYKDVILQNNSALCAGERDMETCKKKQKNPTCSYRLKHCLNWILLYAIILLKNMHRCVSVDVLKLRTCDYVQKNAYSSHKCMYICIHNICVCIHNVHMCMCVHIPTCKEVEKVSIWLHHSTHREWFLYSRITCKAFLSVLLLKLPMCCFVAPFEVDRY